MDIKIDKPGGIHRRARWITVGAVLLFLLTIGLLYWLMTREGVLTVARRDATFYTVQRQPYTDMLVVRAIAIPNESVILSSERGGKVVEICKFSSDPVKKHEVIARLANYDFVLDVTSRIARATEQQSKSTTCAICVCCWNATRTILRWLCKSRITTY